jgi:hypothetical protein
MYGRPFNTNAPFGEVHGDNRYAFEQGGQLYNAQRQPVDIEGRVMPLAPAAAPAAAPREIPTTVVKPVEDPDDDIPADERPFDLLAWAKGDETLKATPWGTIRAQTAQLIEDMTKITNKETARKAILAHYGA